jgi:hypothetical protein
MLRSIIAWFALVGCLQPSPPTTPSPPRPRPPFLYACRREHPCDGVARIADPRPTASFVVSMLGAVGTREEHRARTDGHHVEVRDREGRVVARVPLVFTGALSAQSAFGLRPFDAMLDLGPGEYRLDVVGRGLRMVQNEVRVARVKMFDASTKTAVFLHRGTRVWLGEGVLTIGRFFSTDRGGDPVLVEWERDGAIVFRDDRVRGGSSRPDARATPWRFGETYDLPEAIRQQPGHWIARVHTPHDAVEIAFDIRDGTLAMVDGLAASSGPVSPTLYVRSVAMRPEISAQLERRRRAPESPHVDRDDFAASIPHTPELFRAFTRDRGLLAAVGQFETDRRPRSVAAVELDRWQTEKMSPEQRWRAQRRADRDASDRAAADNRRNRARAPVTRAALLARIAKHGHPFSAGETPK